MIPHIERYISRFEAELKEVESELKQFPEFNEEYGQRFYKHHSHNAVNSLIRNRNLHIISVLKRRDALVLTIKRLKSYVLIKSNVVVEADCEISDMMDNKDTVTHENFEDTAGASIDTSSYGNISTLSTGQYNKLAISNFLSRPLKLSQATIALNDDFTFVSDVWDEFTSHPSVRAKLRNYAYFHGTLNLRITVSGTPWHFGKLQVSYQPLASYNRNLEYLEPQLGGANRHLALAYLSQAKGCRTIDVHDNKPLEIQCPFISPQPMLRLFNKSPLILAAADSYDDMVGFGKLYINSLSPIKAINATATDIGLQVYAWVTDLELGTPTGTVIEIGTEASYETTSVSDEREAGPVERISSKAADIAGGLSDVPIIGKYAHAAEKPLRFMSKVASLFGFSYPTMINAPERMKNEPFQNASQVIGYDTGHRLTLDPKQELSVDPRATGVDTDDMSYDLICKTESLLDTFEWSSADGQLAGSIWMAPINPNVSKRVPFGLGFYGVTPTALGFVAAPHIYWRGDITFRFEVVCSKFHRGTLAVLYEPNISQNVVIDTTLDLNKQFIKKIDLQSVTDFEVTVKWAYPRPWAKVLTPDLFGDLGSVGFLGDQLIDYANGYIAVVPYTELQSPDGSAVTINVYIKSNNMTFNQFTMINVPTSRPVTEASYEPCTPNPVDDTVLNESSASETNISTFNFGETPISFRSTLRRFMGWKNNQQNRILSGTIGPIIRYSDFGMSWPTPSYESHIDSWLNLMGYLRYAYLGMRGGTKHRLVLSGPNNLRANCSVVVRLNSPGNFSDNDLASHSGFQELSCSSAGSTIFMPMTNAGIEFEVPMYTPDLFWISFTEDYTAFSSITQENVTTGYTAYFSTGPITASSTDPVVMSTSSAAAEDFSFMRFSGAPTYMYEVV